MTTMEMTAAASVLMGKMVVSRAVADSIWAMTLMKMPTELSTEPT